MTKVKMPASDGNCTKIIKTLFKVFLKVQINFLGGGKSILNFLPFWPLQPTSSNIPGFQVVMSIMFAKICPGAEQGLGYSVLSTKGNCGSPG